MEWSAAVESTFERIARKRTFNLVIEAIGKLENPYDVIDKVGSKQTLESYIKRGTPEKMYRKIDEIAKLLDVDPATLICSAADVRTHLEDKIESKEEVAEIILEYENKLESEKEKAHDARIQLEEMRQEFNRRLAQKDERFKEASKNYEAKIASLDMKIKAAEKALDTNAKRDAYERELLKKNDTLTKALQRLMEAYDSREEKE